MKGIAGRPMLPKTLVNKALRLVDQNIPEIFQSLIDKALNGDREAAIYLINRRLGMPKATLEVEGDLLGVQAVVELMRARAEERKLDYTKQIRYTIEGGDKDAIQNKGSQDEGQQGVNAEEERG